MNKKDYNTLMQALLKQQKEVTASREAANAFLKKAGVLHLFAPKEPVVKKYTAKSV